MVTEMFIIQRQLKSLSHSTLNDWEAQDLTLVFVGQQLYYNKLL